MALPGSGTISLGNVNIELSQTRTTQISLGQASVRSLYGVASGAIRLAADGYGKSSAPAASYFFSEIPYPPGGAGTVWTNYNAFTDNSDNLYLFSQSNNGEFGYLYTKYNSSGTLTLQKKTSSTSRYWWPLSSTFNGTSHWQMLEDDPDGTGTYYGISVVKHSASTGDESWYRRINGIDAQGGGAPTDIVADSSGNVYCLLGDLNNSCFYFFKYDTNGNLSFQKKLSGTVSPSAGKMTVDSSGNIYLALCNSTGTGLVLIKYNSSGTQQWVKAISGILYDPYLQGSRNITISPSGLIGIGGFYYPGAYDTGYIIVLNSSATAISYQKKTSNTAINAVSFDSSDNLYAVGYNAQSPYNGVVLKYNSSGTIQYQRSLTGPVGSTLRHDTIANNNAYMVMTGFYWLGKLPVDGSKTGTYGSYTYSSTTTTQEAGAYSIASGSVTETTTSFATQTNFGTPGTVTASVSPTKTSVP